jgi:hypothetical protein
MGACRDAVARRGPSRLGPWARGAVLERQPAFRQAELALASAKEELSWANYRLVQARQRLDELGPLSQLRRPGRREKASTLDEIDASTDDIRKAKAKITRCERTVEELRRAVDERRQWDADHDWPDARLRTVDAKLADLGQSADPNLTRDASLLRRAHGGAQWASLDRVVKVVPPPLPGHGIDLGL